MSFCPEFVFAVRTLDGIVSAMNVYDLRAVGAIDFQVFVNELVGDIALGESFRFVNGKRDGRRVRRDQRAFCYDLDDLCWRRGGGRRVLRLSLGGQF